MGWCERWLVTAADSPTDCRTALLRVFLGKLLFKRRSLSLLSSAMFSAMLQAAHASG